MTIDIDLSRVSEWVSDQPAWVVVIAAVAGWYFLAGGLVHLHAHLLPESFAPKIKEDFSARAEMILEWAFSPVLLIAFLGGAVLWALSMGVMPPPWKW